MAEWFGKLYTDVAFPCDRVPRLIDRKEKKYASLQPADQPAFLEEVLDLDEASPALTAIGLKRRELLAKFKSASLPTDFDCTNQIVVDLRTFKSSESAI